MEKIIAVDFYDLIWQSREPWTPERLDELFAGYVAHGVTGVLWRLSVCGRLLYNTSTPDKLTSVDGEINPKCVDLLKRFDPAEEVTALGKKYNIKVYFWLTLFDDFGYGEVPGDHTSEFCAWHPEYSWRSRDGKDFYRGVLSYVYDEVVEFRLNQIREINAYGADGLYLCIRSHSRPAEVRRAMSVYPDCGIPPGWFKENHKFIYNSMLSAIGNFGFDPPAVEAYGREITDLADWQRFRGKYFLNFMQKVRDITPGRVGFGLRYGPGIPEFVYGDNFFDWEKLSDGTLNDFLAYRMTIPPESGDENFTEFYQPRPVKKMLWMILSMKHPENLLKCYRSQWERWDPHLDGVIFFEAYQMTDNPEYWKFLESL